MLLDCNVDRGSMRTVCVRPTVCAQVCVTFRSKPHQDVTRVFLKTWLCPHGGPIFLRGRISDVTITLAAVFSVNETAPTEARAFAKTCTVFKRWTYTIIRWCDVRAWSSWRNFLGMENIDFFAILEHWKVASISTSLYDFHVRYHPVQRNKKSRRALQPLGVSNEHYSGSRFIEIWFLPGLPSEKFRIFLLWPRYVR